MQLSGSEDNSVIGHLNNSWLGGGEEWSIAKLIIDKKAVVTHINRSKVIFGLFII